MQARQLPAGRGFAWLGEGLQLWRRNPALLTFASFGYLLLLILVSVVPFIGQIIASLLTPVLSLGVLNTCRAIDAGRKAGPDVLFSGFQQNLPALIVIGGINFAGVWLVLGLTAIADGGTLFGLMTSGGKLEPEIATSTGFTMALMIAIALSTPVMMAYWFAPLLAGWWQVPAPKAMFFSFFACLRNWRPFLAYSIALALFGAVLPGIVLGIIGTISPTLATLLSVPLPLLLIPIVFASFYTNARDIFGEPGNAPEEA
ncbi:BPSS1780 family membrane protein [Aromatoleum evansii]|uniref:BPSS1780 family membrane protein n=1 Tax=Aromatoleum evansii TaxID=59406 RepID=A0ABZ1AQ08_AROEV|nr:BPSS1780 family membrane protein [Aromatoleum evansii]NMG30224.1 hypothetical protein [Aromatoleum evansii]WRL46969.1 BPSS1780 family membrane protein [Aromatoleum evansii]